MYSLMKILAFNKVFGVLFFCIFLCSASSAGPISYDIDKIMKYATKNRKGKPTHTIKGRPGVPYPVYVSVDTATIIVAPYKIIGVINPSFDIIDIYPQISKDSPGDNYISIKVKDKGLKDSLSTIQIMCEGGYTATLMLNVKDPIHANRYVYIVDPRKTKKRTELSREEAVEKVSQKLNKKIKERDLILNSIGFDHILKQVTIEQIKRYDEKEITIKSIMAYSNYLIFNIILSELPSSFGIENAVLELQKIHGSGLFKRSGKYELFDPLYIISYDSISENRVSLVFKTDSIFNHFKSTLRINKLVFQSTVDFSENEIETEPKLDVW